MPEALRRLRLWAGGIRLLLGSLILLALPALADDALRADYARIPAGKFFSVLSANNAENAPVQVAEFSMRTTPVTVREFFAFTRLHPEWQRARVPSVFAEPSYLHQYASEPLTPELAQQPVTSVSWFAAQAYCESEGARLPTWYEWEYVAAADATRADARRDAAWRAKILGWYSQPSAQSHGQVGGVLNFYGVRDMHGLLWEWVDDFNALLVSADSRNQGDPEKLQYCGAGAISLQDKDNFAILMRVALLSSLSGSDTTNNLGFRCARDLTKDKHETK